MDDIKQIDATLRRVLNENLPKLFSFMEDRKIVPSIGVLVLLVAARKLAYATGINWSQVTKEVDALVEPSDTIPLKKAH